MTTTLAAILAGLGLGFSLIIAIGAQNVFVLRQGLRREHIIAVVVVCAVSDIVLIALGIAGLGALIEQLPWLIAVVRWLGAAFLIGYGLLAARRALRAGKGLDLTGEENPARTDEPTEESRTEESAARGPAGGIATTTATSTATSTSISKKPSTKISTAVTAAPITPTSASLRTAVLTVLALTWLNPHVYLDTVFLLGSIANSHGEERWAFGAGAAVASLVWFTALGFGARLLGRILRTPLAWRIFDGLIAIVMITMGVLLVLPH